MRSIRFIEIYYMNIYDWISRMCIFFFYLLLSFAIGEAL